MEIYDTIIVGFGPAGFTAGLYSGRFLLKTLVIGKDFGGYASKAGVIQNYPGIKNADGYDLTSTIRDQAKEFGATFLNEYVTRIDRKNELFSVETKEGNFLAKTIILATGSERRKLGLVNETELEGKGIHYCVTCDGPVYSGKVVAVVGGGNAGMKGAIMVAEYAKKIYLIVAGKELKAEPKNIENIKKIGDKVEVIYETEIKEIVGNNKIESIILDKEYKGSKEIKIDGLFIEIGSLPANEIAKSLGVLLDEKGYIITDTNMKTNVEGIFAAGDISNLFGSFKQNITAAATGAVAANSIFNYLKNRK